MTAALPRAFRWFWAAEAVSGFGSWMTILALQVLVIEYLHAGAAGVGWMNAARWLPYLLFGIVLGALIDRVRRRPVMIWTDLGRAVLLCSLPLLWWAELLTLPVLLLVVLLFGAATLVNDSASQAFVPRLVPRGALQSAHSRVDGTNAVAETAGPALGGALLSVVAAPVLVLVNAVTFLFSAIAMALIRVDEPRGADSEVQARNLRREIKEGLVWVYRTPSLGVLAVWTHVWFAAQAILATVLAAFVLTTLDLTEAALGVIIAGTGVGGIVGALCSGPVGRRLGSGHTVILAHLCSAVGVLVILGSVAFATRGDLVLVAVLFAGQLCHGFAIGLSNSHEMAYRQQITPDGFQARTNTTMRSINRGVIVLVSPLAGFGADQFGNAAALVVAAVIFLLVVIGLWFSPFRRVRLE